MKDPNFNINLEVGKVMDTLSNSKSIRVWTYLIASLIIIGLAVVFGGNLLKGLADLIRALDGR